VNRSTAGRGRDARGLMERSVVKPAQSKFRIRAFRTARTGAVTAAKLCRLAALDPCTDTLTDSRLWRSTETRCSWGAKASCPTTRSPLRRSYSQPLH